MGHDAPEHEHAPEHAHTRGEISEGEGHGKLLFLDAPSGLAGDMMIAALIDLGVPSAVVADAAAAVGITGFHVHFGSRARCGIVGTSFEVHVDEAQPLRTYAMVRELLDGSSLSRSVKTRAHATFRRLAEAEARVHRMPVDDVHFHEVGAVDAVVDVVGSAAALDWLGAELWVSPLPMGHGYTKSLHGRIPLPPPAVVECLRGFATYDAGLEFELVTPTGAAIVAAHSKGWSRWPSLVVERAGWGAGTADLPDRPNLLRAVLGEPRSDLLEGRGTHVVLEANIDDATGELLGAAIEAVLGAGALDVWASPATMKKGRPAWVLGAVADLAHEHAVAWAILAETTSIGVRRHTVSRVERPRSIVEIETSFGPIPVKVATGAFGGPQVKPEFDACLRVAKEKGVPVREVVHAALAAAFSRGVGGSGGGPEGGPRGGSPGA